MESTRSVNKLKIVKEFPENKVKPIVSDLPMCNFALFLVDLRSLATSQG